MGKILSIKNWWLSGNFCKGILMAVALFCHCYFFGQTVVPSPQQREELFGEIVRDQRNFSEYEQEFKFAERNFAFRSLKEENYLQLGNPDDSLFIYFVDTTELTNKGKFYAVREALEQNDIIHAENINSGIASSNIVEENIKKIHEIYLKTLAVEKTDFDSLQISTLEEIACQDPLIGGEAVYSARVMLKTDGICAPSARKAFYDMTLDTVNLVPNYSFEEFDTCPHPDEITFPVNVWFQPCNELCSTSDYFNICDSDGYAGVPSNSRGYQFSKQGNAYAGIICLENNVDFYREYIEIKLISPLVQNKKYCVSFYVSLADTRDYAINTIGALFTPDSFLLDSFNQEVFLIPQVENKNGIISDTMNWTEISGNFIATGGEQFLTIGNFRNDANTDDSLAYPINYKQAYYYIDYISVRACETNSVAENKPPKGNDDDESYAEIYPNPNDGRMSLKYSLENSSDASLQIFDLKGALLFTQKLNPEKNSIVLDNLALGNGIFYYSITVDGKRTINKKLVVIR